MNKTEKKYRFEIDPHVVLQLGAELVTDHIQALVELVKNAYDADATYANVIVDTKSTIDDERSAFKDETGFVVIEDNGIGMDSDVIEKGWLWIASSPKRDMKHRGKTGSSDKCVLGPV